MEDKIRQYQQGLIDRYRQNSIMLSTADVDDGSRLIGRVKNDYEELKWKYEELTRERVQIARELDQEILIGEQKTHRHNEDKKKWEEEIDRIVGRQKEEMIRMRVELDKQIEQA